MTAFTVNGGGVTNWQSLSGGSVVATLDTYAISNNTTLLIDTDSFLCTNHSVAFGSLDTVTFSGIGGLLKIDGTNVRVIPYNTGTGNVPAIGTTVSQGGVSGYLLGVWSGWQVEPTASGAAMPATGFIKIKDKAGGSFAAGALTGIGASATGADVVGWIEVRGADTASITVPRIGKFQVTGDWFELGTTNGARGQILTCPTTGTVAGVFPGVWIETAAGSDIYERFAGCGSLPASAANPTDERGKVIWQTTGGIRIGSDGTNNVGFLPPTGCRVRIPNVILTNCTRTVSGSGPRVLPNDTLTTRQEFITTSAGDVDIDGVVCYWYASFNQSFKTKIHNCAISANLIITEQSAPIDVDNVIVSPTQAQIDFALQMNSNFGGGTVKDCVFYRYSLASSGSYPCVPNYNKDITFDNVLSGSLVFRGNSNTGTWSATQNQNCTWLNCKVVGGRMLLVGDVNGTIQNLAYANSFAGTTTNTLAQYAIDRSIGCLNTKIIGFSSLVTNSHPYNGIVVTYNSYDLEVREIGTFAAPYSMGSANQAGLIINGGGNNDGIKLKRVYVSNTRTGAWAFLNSDANITIENVNGDYADASVMAGLNAQIKGCGLTGATTGQTSVYGTHWMDVFTSTTAGKIEILCNEPTTATASQCAVTSGTPRFNSLGQALLTTVGDQVTWEMPYFAKGHTALANIAPVFTGTLTANLTYQYQIDAGSGYGTLKTLNAANLSAETITAATGFKLRLIATCATANATNALTNIRILTVTTSTAQSTNLYALDTVTVTIAANASLAGAEIRIYDLDGVPAGSLGTELDGTESNAGSTFTFLATPSNDIWVQIMASGFVEYGQMITVPATDTTINILLSNDINA